MSKCKTTAEFTLEGRFLGFVVKDGYKIKGIVLETATGDCTVKLSKVARASCPAPLLTGMWLRVMGTQKTEEDGELKLRADRVLIAEPGCASQVELPESLSMLPRMEEPVVKTTKSTILVCQKSDCCKRGGRAVTEALQSTLRDHQLAEQVTIKMTGCMKRCKAGPNIVMPDKTRYSAITAKEIPLVVSKHFPKTEGCRSLNVN